MILEISYFYYKYLSKIERFFIERNTNKKMLFAIDGNIGSGKSSRVNDLKKYLKGNPSFIFLQEPVDDWNSIKTSDGITILEKFYSNQEKKEMLTRQNLIQQSITT